jgi:hypothetical protein
VDEGLSCGDEVLGTMPQATLAVRRAAFRQLLSGRAVAIEEVAAEAGLAGETAREAADLVASVGLAEIDEGTIIGMDGLTTRRTRHRLAMDGVGLWTWCAYDIVGIAAALGADAVGSTQYSGCGRGIEVVIRDGPTRGRHRGGGVAARRVLLERDGRILPERPPVLLPVAPGPVEGAGEHRVGRGAGPRVPRGARLERLAPARSVTAQAERSTPRSWSGVSEPARPSGV